MTDRRRFAKIMAETIVAGLTPADLAQVEPFAPRSAEELQVRAGQAWVERLIAEQINDPAWPGSPWIPPEQWSEIWSPQFIDLVWMRVRFAVYNRRPGGPFGGSC